MADYNEKPFEDEICAHLEANGWLYSPNSTGYDKARAIFPEDVLGWLRDTQPEQLDKIVKPTASAHDQQQSRTQLLDRVVKVLDTPLDQGGGTLNLLRNGFKHTSAKFDMCQWKPATSINPVTTERYSKVRVRVMRQVFYSENNKRSLDLVLFINGLPVATLELKTDFTQSVQDAIAQYRTTRLPKDAATNKIEPLFGFGSRALVHFAVSNSEVHMTTKLTGAKTFFLPFNMGDNEGAGNPLNPHGSQTSYLWERVLQRDSWLSIVGKLMHVETVKETDPISGKVSSKMTMLFPRFHQWEVVTNLVSTARSEGTGHRYLIQHSAGSGKTNSIAWTAHALATLHGADDAKVFDSVIVITDRTVLDAQLQEAIRQIDSTTGVVATITGDEASKSGLGAKSALLAQELLSGRLIIVVTIQTFPHAMKEIRSNKGLKGKRFAIIADEAHSSQTGSTANKLKEVLTAAEVKDLDDGGQIDAEALLAAEMTARADASNLSYFAFTATPKAKTLELFGRTDADGKPRPFHLYSMQQAIEEGFILDVLKNYTPYDTAFRVGTKAGADPNGTRHGPVAASAPSETLGAAPGDTERLVDESEAVKGLMRWVKLHPTNIAQKVQIIVEHFRENVAHLLDGHAKAMVVTDSRKAAVRYKNALDAYIAKHGYSNVTALVAFSGEVHDMDPADGPGPFTETALNPGLKGRDLRTAFATDDYRVMIVANKFQTGFDQPLLSAMYVDKRLSGVTAVQTLSRLNRTLPSAGKSTTFVLDFVNEPEDILAAFKTYYREATLVTPTDPNLVHDLQAKLDQADIYTEVEIDGLVAAWFGKKGNSALDAAIGPSVHRFQSRYATALQGKDKAELDVLDTFRKDVSTFVRIYDFLSQIVDYGDTDLEKRSIFFKLLERRIRPSNIVEPFDLSDVELLGIKQTQGATVTLDPKTGEIDGLHGITAAGSGAKKDPKMVLLAEVLARLNDLFGGDFTEGTMQSWVEGMVTVMLENDLLRTQAEQNSKSQFVDSPDLSDAVTDVVMSNQTTHNKMTDMFYADQNVRITVTEMLGELFHLVANKDPATSTGGDRRAGRAQP